MNTRKAIGGHSTSFSSLSPLHLATRRRVMSRIEFPLLPTASELPPSMLAPVTSERQRIRFGPALLAFLARPITESTHKANLSKIISRCKQRDRTKSYTTRPQRYLSRVSKYHSRQSTRERARGAAEKRIFCLKSLLAWARRCDFRVSGKVITAINAHGLYAKKIFHSF